MRHLGKIGVVSSGINRGMKGFVHPVVALRIAALDKRAQLLVHGLGRPALDRAHAFDGEPRA